MSVKLVVDVGFVLGAAVAGWIVGAKIGLAIGLAVDKATSNDFVTSALLTIPLFGWIGILAMTGTALRIVTKATRSG